MIKKHKQFFVTYESDKYDRNRYNSETCDYGSYEHDAGNASTLRGAKQYFSKVRKNKADENPKNFKIWDCWSDPDKAIVVFEER